MIARFRGRVARTVWVAISLALVLAVSTRWLERWRLPSPDRAGARLYRVTSGADSGPGSLREGIFAADRAAGRARITIDVPKIVLESPLPPLVNPAGVVIDARAARAVVDASALSAGPVLDVIAPDSVIVGLRIERARGEAVMVRQRGARLTDVTVVDSETGVLQIDGAIDLVIDGSRFEQNTIGVQTAGAGWPVIVRNTRFSGHRRAAIWAVRPDGALFTQTTGLEIVRNTFSGDRQSLVVLNVPSRIQRNTFEEAHAAAVYASGTNVVLTNNRMRSGRNFGIYLERVDHSVVANNELDHNCSGGLMLRNSRDTQVTLNRVYSNGYGIIVVRGLGGAPNTLTENLITQHAEDGLYVIGGSPVIRHNRLLQNRKSGLRVSSLASPDRQLIESEPMLEGNVLTGNGQDSVQRDQYVQASREIAVDQPTDCSWRRGATQTPQIARADGGS